ncbi:MAG: cache domain-containing protein [Silicimonas sp.]|nr:cache domain-containing protein [Silicimonas sp.]
MKRLALSTVLAATLAAPGYANEFEPAMRSFFEQEINQWATASILVDAINDQNVTTQAYDQARIDALDTAWRAEVGLSQSPTITPVISNEAAEFLRSQIASSGGRITEIFVMDNQGLNVAASATTSDYWQGDEAKFTETHGVGPGAVHFGDIEFDESSQTYQGQISLTITDPSTGEIIGAMTVGVDAESLL